MSNDLKAVFFDAEGTFLRFDPPLGEIYRELWSKHGVTIDPESTEQALRSVYREVFQEKLKPPLNGDICKRAWKEVFDRVFEDLKSHPQFDHVFKEAYDFFASPKCVKVVSDFREFIEAIRKRNVRIAVISNWDCRLYSVLEGHHLLHLFDAVFLGCEVGYLKPDLRIFQRALEYFKVGPENAIMIGDSLKDDIEPAIKLNMRYFHVGENFSFKNLLQIII